MRKKFRTCKIDTPNVSLSANLGEHVKLARYSSVDNITMERYSYVGQFTQIVSAEIGAFCSIGEMCSIGSWEHPLNYLITSPCVAREIINMPDAYNDKPAPAFIGNDVWIGNGVFVRGIKIGNGVIGANAVVTSAVSEYAIVAGVPAKVIKYRFKENIIKRLKALEWWNWADEKILQNKHALIHPLTETLTEVYIE